MKRANFCCLIGFVFCLLCAQPCRADGSAPSPENHLSPENQEAALLLNRVLNSEYGRGIKPVTVVYVIPSVRAANLPPVKPHTRTLTNKIYLITSANVFYSLLLTPTRVILEWQAVLVPSDNKSAMKPVGSLGKLLEALGRRIPNHAAIGKHGVGGSFLADIDNPGASIVYRLAQSKLVRVNE